MASVLHRIVDSIAESVGLFLDQCHDHAVEIEKEHDQVKAQLDERFLKPTRIVLARRWTGGPRSATITHGHTFL